MQIQQRMDEILASGATGTAAVAGLHQLSRRFLRDAPRLDVMGERIIEKAYRRFGREPPENTRFLSWALGNVGTDTVLFALVAAGNPRRPVIRGTLLGALVGAMAIALPPALGVGAQDTARSTRRALLTAGIYVLAGVAAGLAQHLSRKIEEAVD